MQILVSGAHLVRCIRLHAKHSPDPMIDKKPRRHQLRKFSHSQSAGPCKDFQTKRSVDMENYSLRRARPSQEISQNHGRKIDDCNNSHTDVSNTTTFVNYGLLRWQEQRKEWIGNKSRSCRRGSREPVLNPATTYDDLLATSRPFPKPIPLQEMVNFLIDVWREEGLYDNV